jgi:hypothetical protein
MPEEHNHEDFNVCRNSFAVCLNGIQLADSLLKFIFSKKIAEFFLSISTHFYSPTCLSFLQLPYFLQMRRFTGIHSSEKIYRYS